MAENLFRGYSSTCLNSLSASATHKLLFPHVSFVADLKLFSRVSRCRRYKYYLFSDTTYNIPHFAFQPFFSQIRIRGQRDFYDSSVTIMV